ncbi:MULTISPECIES: MDR family MFS transporter [Peribacillus]|uniref:MFS transporter n=1 Tax=Peribacillus butanolivorans TaxID=421767 RepID=A0ABN5N397_9BACI|nr:MULTISPECIES: MDR family MFS transporter [Peribacillus]AXN39739.1 MFS transporter [Peribacillus butanolivorans]MBK5460162.1 multidrug efflux MFS transporter [Peribacillus sp. TH27]MBK5481976.1 multidrug efflux MFS transporter [Peribacillus sp. TH16]MBK5498351.1 multidrug efflux MFS transporter [Peribacillus sp. TH14]WMX56534.1 MDR family MFS transporter [Peribacillus sp. R9-11]
MSTDATQQQNPVIRTTPILISFLIAGFIGLFSETALNMALGDLIQEFNVSPSTVQWLTTGYLLTLGILVPVSGLLIQWFNTRQLFIASMVFSIIGTLIAAIAPGFGLLMLARVIQAVGTGLLLPLMFNTILVIFPIHKRGATMGLMGLVIMFAPAIGPTVSGLIIENLTWHFIFWVSLPFFVIALLFGLKYMQNVSTITKPKIDVPSIILSTIGFGGIVYGFSIVGDQGWRNAIVLSSIIVGLVALFLFAVRQFNMDKPMIDLRVFKYPMFTLGLITVFITFMIIMSSMILLPLYLQTGLALAAFSAGLVLLPGGVLNGFMSPITGRIFDKFGPRGLVIPGFIIMIAMLWTLTNVTTETSIIMVIVMHTFLMIGVSMVMMPAQTNGLNQLPKNLYPDGTALMNTLQQVSGAIGTTVAITIMSASQKNYMASVEDPFDPSTISGSLTAGVQDAFVFGLVLAIVGLIVSFFIKTARDK